MNNIVTLQHCGRNHNNNLTRRCKDTKTRSGSRLWLCNSSLSTSRVSFQGRRSCLRFEVSLKIRIYIHICKKMHAWYWWSLVRDKITDMLGGRIGKLRLAELIVKLLEFERNVYWRMGWRLKCLTGSYGPQGRKTSQVRRYCYVYGLILSRGGMRLPWLNTLRTGLLNCLNARSRGLTFRHRASCV